MSRMHTNLAAAIVLGTCATGLLAACGDDGDDTAAVEETPGDGTADATAAPPTVATPTVATTADGDDAAPVGIDSFCDAYTEITIQMSSEPDPAAIAANVEVVKQSAPDEVAAQTAVMTDAVESVLASNGTDFSAMEAPAFAAAQGEVDPFVFENCEFDATIEAIGKDYAFEGIPDTMEGGRVGLLFTNEGAEAHEIAIMRRNDGVSESFEELLGLPEEEAMAKVTPIGGTFAPTTGSSALLVGDFAPGDYIAICFIPSGTMVADGEMTEGTGAPHFVHGMQHEFSVTE
jgi:hypothetical protein